MGVKKALSAVATTAVVATALSIASWFVYSWATGATLVIFRTGSMSPMMPQGAIAVSLPIDARDIEVGDVITVQRSDRDLPVTHRVVEVREPDRSGDDLPPPNAKELILKGDANETVDMRPYTVTRARQIVVSVPHVGNALMLAQSPLGIGVMVLAAGALTTWAFWPTRGQTDEDMSREEVPAA